MTKKEQGPDLWDLMTVKEVAARAKVHEKTVRKAVAQLNIAVRRIGDTVRISEAAYRDWIRRNTQDAVL